MAANRAEEMHKPGIFVAVPCYGMVHMDFTACLISLLVHDPERAMVINQRESSIVHWCRNGLANSFLSFNAKCREDQRMDYILWIDSDMIFQPEHLQMLLDADKDIVSGMYCTRKEPWIPAAGYCSRQTKWKCEAIEQWNVGVQEVDYVGFGFVLVKRRVLENVPMPFFTPRRRRNHQAGEYGEDISFCLKAKTAGFKIHVHTDALIGHIGKYVYTMADVEAYRDWSAAQSPSAPRRLETYSDSGNVGVAARQAMGYQPAGHGHGSRARERSR